MLEITMMFIAGLLLIVVGTNLYLRHAESYEQVHKTIKRSAVLVSVWAVISILLGFFAIFS